MQPNEIAAMWAQKGAAIGDCGRMCNDCAFKVGTEANRDLFLIDNVVHGVIEDPNGMFYCHSNLPDGVILKKDIPCVGFLYAKKYFEKIDATKRAKKRPDVPNASNN